MRKSKWLCLMMSVTLLFAGCAKKEEPKTEEKKQEKNTEEIDVHEMYLSQIRPYAYSSVDGIDLEPGTYLSVIGKRGDSDYWREIEEGVKAATSDLNKELGYKGEDKIKVVYNITTKEDAVDEQVNILDEELARYPAALAISLIDSQSCVVQFDLATMNGIPLVAFESASSYPGFLARIGTNNKEAAKTAAVHTAEEMQEQGKILIFAHDSISQTGKDRTEAFIKEIEENHKGIEVISPYYMDRLDEKKEQMAEEINQGYYSLEEGCAKGHLFEIPEQPITKEEITDDQVMDYILRRNPEASCIYATDGGAMTKVLNLCEREQKDLILTGFDIEAREIKALKEKKIAGLVMQNPYGMGYATVIAAARSALGMANEAEVDTGFTWITSDMAAEEEIEY